MYPRKNVHSRITFSNVENKRKYKGNSQSRKRKRRIGDNYWNEDSNEFDNTDESDSFSFQNRNASSSGHSSRRVVFEDFEQNKSKLRKRSTYGNVKDKCGRHTTDKNFSFGFQNAANASENNSRQTSDFCNDNLKDESGFNTPDDSSSFDFQNSSANTSRERRIVFSDSEKKKSQHSFQRKYPLGVKVMQSLLEEKEPYMIPVELLKNNSGYDILLDDPELRDFKIDLVIKLLKKSLSTRANDEGVIDLLIKTFRNTNFCQKLINFISKMKFESSNAKDCLPLIGAIMTDFLLKTPANAYPLISNLVDVCFGVIMHLKIKNPSFVNDIEQSFQNIQLHITECHNKSLAINKSETENTLAPPDDFRNHDVIPTCNELNALDKPFLRPNIIKGKYKNSDHYLDVQFRLLKEDFIRPLREGLMEYRKTKSKRNSDVRVYQNVTVESTSIDGIDFVYHLRLNLRKNFKIENSKRFMYGNIVCISSDNFGTMITASVANRDRLKDHIIAIKLESEPFKMDMSLTYSIIESRAYFVAYKHTLLALQGIREVPLKHYVVHVTEQKQPPSYVLNSTIFEFNLDADYGDDYRIDVRILDPIENWPTSEEMNMDESQRRALYGALTRQLAIIQGPPGTGKTYLGLQITKILLSNKAAWNPRKTHPILVVCYTNHALDQFLEGILSFTTNVIRVGSRSKNQTLAQYQINKRILNSYNYPNSFEIETILKNYNKLSGEIRGVCCAIEAVKDIIKSVNTPGIISIESFSMEFPKIIPYHLQRQILICNMRRFLNGKYYENYEEIENIQIHTKKRKRFDENDNLNKNKTLNEKNVNSSEMKITQEKIINENPLPDYDEATDMEIDEEILKEEELNRRIDDEDEEPFPKKMLSEVRFPYFKFDITPDEIIFSIQNFRSTSQIKQLKAELKAISESRYVNFTEEECKEIEKISSIKNMTLIQRWKLYNYWISELEIKYRERLTDLETLHVKLSKSLVCLKDLKYLNIMKTADIIGMTTTAAAQYCKILHDLGPPIVIIEESAEIMESHLVTSLSSECKHLIIIGDHQQLKPKPNVFELGRKYHLDTSFFERMIKNGIIYETLEYQHRMKPLISNLLVPTIYKDLKDHPSVFNYPKVKGIKEDLFFLDHTVFENPPVDDIESFGNNYEAEFLMGLCRHLIFQGYKEEDITIITPYLGQHRLLKQFQRRTEFLHCADVRICILDNYQGEESNIILISLVRSNKSGKVGFVKIDNRVCVALSRAKHGMYIIGNMSQMTEASELWKKIKKKLVDGGNIGPELQLECQNHPDQILKVKSYEDILGKSPEGGCKLPCSAIIPKCGHSCPRVCHTIDNDHEFAICKEPCPRTCNFGHACQKRCFQECEKCVVRMKKLLPCKHEHLVQCSVEPNLFNCTTIITRELPHCKHKQEMECYIDISTYSCKEKCTSRLDCGHQCKKRCHPLKDPHHENYNCGSPCSKTPINCEFDHKCKKKCYEECGICSTLITRQLKCGHRYDKIICGVLEKDIKCPQKCENTLPCGHKCLKSCGEECDGCRKIVSKIVAECSHTVRVACGKTPTRQDCNGRCTKLLACQHRCTNKCNEACTLRCLQLVESKFKCARGHSVKLSCYSVQANEFIGEKRLNCTDLEGETVGEHCSELCGMKLECGHKCKGKCGECLNGRLHVTCRQKCNKTLVCGHICTEPCGMDCPPCQSKCLWKCSHSQCNKKCGVLCINCQEPCNRKCSHQSCKTKCGKYCTITPCSYPCPKKLKKCGHECIGYCGEPCPKQCRICDKEEVTEIFFGTEEDEDARFVLLEDCGHIFEGKSLDEWMTKSNLGDGKMEISMKLCPRCTVPIYGTRRYQNIILKTYNYVMEVKRKHFRNKIRIHRFQLVMDLKELWPIWTKEISTLRLRYGYDENYKIRRIQRAISDQQYSLYEFQMKFLKAAKVTRKKLKGKIKKLINLVNRLMKYNLTISHQTMNEFSCELRRLEICSHVERIRTNMQPSHSVSPLNSLVSKIDDVMNPTTKFDKDSEYKVIAYLKEAEKYCGSLGITDKERLQIIKGMGLKQGHWYACPKGHVYCITECGGAMVESVCPECKARIGGSSHRLRSDNRVATEMDGARRSAWPGGP